MTDETPGDPSSDSDKPIILGGPSTPRTDISPPPPEAVTPETVAATRPPEPVPAREPRSVVMPLLGLIGFLILTAAIVFLWVRPVRLPSMPAMPPDQSSDVAALRSDVGTLKTQLAALDQRETSDVAALHAAIAALPAPAPAQAPAGPSPPPSASASAAPTAAAPDTALAATVSTLSDRLGQMQAALGAQAQKTQSLPSATAVSDLASRVDAMGEKASKDDSAIRQDISLVQQQLATLSGQAQTLAKSSAALPQLTAQADKLGQIVRAQEALRAGLPLGTIPNAPPALVRFADTAPPTEAALQLSFADAAQAATKAGEPTPDQGHFWHRIWLRVQNLVMVRQGDRVVLGDPTSATLARAQTVLDAGDLSGALTVLGTLTGPAAAAMAPWEAQARALLQAREALTHMAAG